MLETQALFRNKEVIDMMGGVRISNEHSYAVNVMLESRELLEGDIQ